MILEIFKWFSLTRETVRNRESARRLAMGCAFGVVIGLIPKDSAFVFIFGVLLLCTTANVLMAAVSGFIFTWIGHFADTLTHKLGALVLTSDRLEPMWTFLYDLPVLPWTRFNNTVVMGNLILAALVFYPVYKISCHFFDRYGPTIRRKAERNRIFRWVMGAEVNAEMEGAR